MEYKNVEEFLESINGARLVWVSGETGLVYVWHGGFTVNIYEPYSLVEIDMFTFPSIAYLRHEGDLEYAIESIKEHDAEVMADEDEA